MSILANFWLFLRLSNCASVGEKNSDYQDAWNVCEKKKKETSSFLLQHSFHSVEYMYNYLVEYNAVFALLYVFRNISFFYSERSNWRSVEL